MKDISILDLRTEVMLTAAALGMIKKSSDALATPPKHGAQMTRHDNVVDLAPMLERSRSAFSRDKAIKDYFFDRPAERMKQDIIFLQDNVSLMMDLTQRTAMLSRLIKSGEESDLLHEDAFFHQDLLSMCTIAACERAKHMLAHFDNPDMAKVLAASNLTAASVHRLRTQACDLDSEMASAVAEHAYGLDNIPTLKKKLKFNAKDLAGQCLNLAATYRTCAVQNIRSVEALDEYPAYHFSASTRASMAESRVLLHRAGNADIKQAQYLLSVTNMEIDLLAKGGSKGDQSISLKEYVEKEKMYVAHP